MKRHPAFHPLGRDHHALLLLARGLEGKDPRRTPEHTLARWRSLAPGIRAHLAEEAALPLALHQGRQQEADHARLLAFVGDHDAGSAAGHAPGLAEALRAHVELHERGIFEHLQAACTQQELQQVGDALAKLRAGSPMRLDEACSV